MGGLDAYSGLKMANACRSWTWHHVTTFLITFFGYAFFHACRKAFSNIKDPLQKELTASPKVSCPRPFSNRSCYLQPYDIWNKRHLFDSRGDANVFLGTLDTIFLFSYAIGLYLSGMIGDRVNLRFVLSFGMCMSSVAFFCFGFVSEISSVYNKYYYAVFYLLNGLLQSTGWPTTVAIMGNWFSKTSGGLVFGFWSANASVGNIIGSVMVASVLNYGYDYGILVTSFLLFCGGFIVFFCLIPRPEDIGLSRPEEFESETIAPDHDICVPEDSEKLLNGYNPSDNENYNDNTDPQVLESKTALGFFKALLLPGVIPYSLSYACLKLVNYSFFFWLPVYLSQGLRWKDKKSDELSNFYDIGGIIGGIIAGIISDFIGKRSPVVFVMLILSMVSLFVYGNAGGNYDTNVSLMTLTGLMIGGPANLISSAISADLGKQDILRGNEAALATVTGIVDGTGSVGAAIGQYLVPQIDNAFGWHGVFYFLIVMTFFSGVCILPMLIRDLSCSRNPRPVASPFFNT